MSSIARYFDEAKHDGSYLPGVPLRDLTEEEFAGYPKWLQASVDAQPYYHKTKQAEPTKPAPKPEKE